VLANPAIDDYQNASKDNRTMAQEENKSGAADPKNAGNGKQPTLNILAQYVKDLSFESPNAPASLRSRTSPPDININVNVNANPLSEKEFDVVLTLSAQAGQEKGTLFNVELVYGGVFNIDGFPQEHVLPILFIECPRLLFPFARQIIAEATRNGGFPPLLIDPIDFAAMFQKKVAEEQAKSKVQVS
jgi:preprotein translocase subunit SecB